MSHSINPGYGFSVTHSSQLLEAQIKIRQSDEDSFVLSLYTPHHSLALESDDSSSLNCSVYPAAPIGELVSFFEEIVSTYKKYQDAVERKKNGTLLTSPNVSLYVSDAMEQTKIKVGNNIAIIPNKHLEELRDILVDYFQIIN